LGTGGFFGSPSSQYTWNNSSTADSLVVTDTGTYSVTVNFVDGCTISDAIHISLQIPLPVSLTAFAADVQQCESHLNWTITNAVNFSHFIIEQSKDGRNFVSVGKILYAKDVYDYSYIDKVSDAGTTFYRLKLVDIDGKNQYSNVVSVQSNCKDAGVKVYPTISNRTIYVSLPEGYEQATLSVFNLLSQQLTLSPTDKVKGYVQ
jgi:trimeric autotransporter adhesin